MRKTQCSTGRRRLCRDEKAGSVEAGRGRWVLARACMYSHNIFLFCLRADVGAGGGGEIGARGRRCDANLPDGMRDSAWMVCPYYNGRHSGADGRAGHTRGAIRDVAAEDSSGGHSARRPRSSSASERQRGGLFSVHEFHRCLSTLSAVRRLCDFHVYGSTRYVPLPCSLSPLCPRAEHCRPSTSTRHYLDLAWPCVSPGLRGHQNQVSAAATPALARASSDHPAHGVYAIFRHAASARSHFPVAVHAKVHGNAAR